MPGAGGDATLPVPSPPAPRPLPALCTTLGHPKSPTCVLQAPRGARGGSWRCHGEGPHLLEIPQGLRLGKGTNLQVSEQTSLRKGARVSSSGAVGPSWPGRHRVFVALTPRTVLGCWERARVSSTQRSKAPRTSCLRDVTGRDTGTSRGPGSRWLSPGVMHAAGALSSSTSPPAGDQKVWGPGRLSGCPTCHAAGSGEHGCAAAAAGVPVERSTRPCHLSGSTDLSVCAPAGVCSKCSHARSRGHADGCAP